ncbi:hypothetical protein [Ancrocorticia populi]|uniref:Uncharacterized protein n=1 Tax=Ancrocorticia populi TaxID=2175228 RepID=A0A2V1KA19_9ACTO|nr:hypothetical protein [Ancrocorticia populi]MDN6485985.1 hypothetical protein [Ancrocorticia sp.]PWF27622.1 hypothetical protein DD236_04390 [Ancrocorticia populi]
MKISTLLRSLLNRADPPGDSERGDVPGWVLVTLMTAGLVIAIWAVAGPALVDVFNTAISRITSI